MSRFPSICWCGERCERQYIAAQKWLQSLDPGKMDGEGADDSSELWSEMLAEHRRRQM